MTTPGAPEPGGGAAASASGAPRRRLRVLVVEDEALIAMEIEDLLAALGHEVVGGAMDAATAVEIAGVLRPDLVTMDVNLRGRGDGIGAAIDIFERYGVRSVFVSAYGGDEMLARAAPARPLGWLVKPIRRERLAALVQAAASEEPA
jgi:DNA-binding NarL/FixJ family response regulator